jgi:hypothetical protein
MNARTYEERLAAWAVVFPHEADELPNVAAEWLVSLEGALQELRETGRPIPNTDRLDVLTDVQALLNSLGSLRGQP